MVSGGPHRRTTFSNCMKISMEKIDTSAAARHSHCSTGVGNTVFQDMRWSAPNEAPKRHITGQRILEWYSSRSQYASTISLAGALRPHGRQVERFSFKFLLLLFSRKAACLVCCEAIFSWTSCVAFCSASCSFLLGFLQRFVLGFFLKNSRCEIPDGPKRILLSYALIIKYPADSHRLEGRLLPRKHIW